MILTQHGDLDVHVHRFPDAIVGGALIDAGMMSIHALQQQGRALGQMGRTGEGILPHTPGWRMEKGIRKLKIVHQQNGSTERMVMT